MSNSDIIQNGHSILIRMPSLNVKMVLVKEKSKVCLGKFGSFPISDILGKPYGLSYEIVKNRAIVQNQVADYEEIVETMANNQNALDDTANQKLSHEEIEQLKKSTLDGNLAADKIVETVVANHSKFEEKTEYSKAKYIKRKEAKFLRFFTPIKPNLYNIAEFYYKKNPAKTKEMRMDTLSQMLTFGNVFPGSRLLVVDDTQGLVVASILERLGGIGEVVCIHETEFSNFDIVRFFNFSREQFNPMYTIRWDKLQKDYVPPEIEAVTGDAIAAERREKRIQTRLEFIEKRDAILKGGFDGLFIASSTTHPLGILEGLAPLLAPSRQVVMYSMYKEPLIETQLKMRESPQFLNPHITESWLRQYQVLPGRSHPDMNSPGASGFLLTSTTILDRGDATPISSKVINPATKRARRKLELQLATETA